MRHHGQLIASYGYAALAPARVNWFFTKVASALQTVMTGDDHISPKKILERRYIYLALLTTRFRDLRRQNDRDLGDDGGARDLPSGTSRPTDTDLEALYEQATDELDAKNLDRMTNVQLRQELQDALNSQVRKIFEAFHGADERLSLQEAFRTEDGRGTMQEEEVEPFRNVEWSPFLEILYDEHTHVKSLMCDAERGSLSNAFFKRKKDALETLLQFHEKGLVRQEDSSDGLDSFGVSLSATSDGTLRLMRQYQTVNLVRSSLIREKLGYSVLTLKSLIPGAGRGAFLDGHAEAGAVVAFQPGDVWPKEHLLTNSADVIEHFEGEDDCHVSLRFDDYVIDSRESPVTVLIREGSLNPWAIGHMANHPPATVGPNCQSTMLNFTERMGLGQLLRYVPNTYARPPGWQSRFFDHEEVVMHGLCLLALRDVANEEIVYDYRLQSEVKPNWYSVVKYGDSFLDKDQVVFFRDDLTKKT